MKIERTIIFPLHDNNGVSLNRELANIELFLLKTCGGYSKINQSGIWTDERTGQIYTNESLRIVTTIEPDIDEQVVKRIPVWCEELRQLAIYTHAVTVHALFVEPQKQETVTR